MPRISVVMPVYNGEKYLTEAIESVLRQDFKDFEFIIIDDGSSDQSAVICQSFSDARIKYIHREHRGLIASLNEGISLSKGEYIARMDADDVCLSNRFSRQLKAMVDNQVHLVGSWARQIDENGQDGILMSYPPLDYRKIKNYFILHNPFIHSSVLVKKEVFSKVGLYNKSFKHAEDYELWSRVLKKYTAININEVLIKYRISESGITKKNQPLMRYQGLRVRLLGLFRLFL